MPQVGQTIAQYRIVEKVGKRGMGVVYMAHDTNLFDGRCIDGTQKTYSSYPHGTKGMAIASKDGDCEQRSSLFKSQSPIRDGLIWESSVKPERNPYQSEWNDLMDALRDNKPYNETARGVEANLVANMGRMAARTGREITWEEALNRPHDMAPNADKFSFGSPAPLKADANGRHPFPQPGIVTDREY